MLSSSRRRDQNYELRAARHQNRLAKKMTEMPYPMETQLALIRRDIEEIHHALHGDGKGRKGLVDQVEELVMVADRGRFSLRVALWLGGGIVAAATAVAQFKQAILGLFHQ
jgi:hypothetical protein